MELHKLTTTDLKGFDAAKLRETEHDLRKQLVDIRMDIYTAKSASAAKVSGLRKSLARLLTVRNELARKNPAPAKAPKAKAEAPKADKPAKAAAAKKPAKASAAKPAAKAKTKTATKK